MAAALLNKSQFQILVEHAAMRRPFRHTENRLISPTITPSHIQFLTSKLTRRKAAFSQINNKAKTIVPIYSEPSSVVVKVSKKASKKTVEDQKKTNQTKKVPEPVVDLGNIEPHKASLLKAMAVNGWYPDKPLAMKAKWYLDPRELFYRVARVQLCGGIANAGVDGDRVVELFSTLATNFLGRICFKDQGHMANMAEDLIQEATTKCALVVDRFNVWDTKEPGKLNNAFAYFTTVARNKMFETLTSNLAVSDVHIEDLKTDSQSVGDLI